MSRVQITSVVPGSAVITVFIQPDPATALVAGSTAPTPAALAQTLAAQVQSPTSAFSVAAQSASLSVDASYTPVTTTLCADGTFQVNCNPTPASPTPSPTPSFSDSVPIALIIGIVVGVLVAAIIGYCVYAKCCAGPKVVEQAPVELSVVTSIPVVAMSQASMAPITQSTQNVYTMASPLPPVIAPVMQPTQVNSTLPPVLVPVQNGAPAPLMANLSMRAPAGAQVTQPAAVPLQPMLSAPIELWTAHKDADTGDVFYESALTGGAIFLN